MDNAIKYFKMHLTAVIFVVIAIAISIFWITPDSIDSNNRIYQLNSEIAASYDTASNQYKDIQHILNLQNEINKYKSKSELIKIMKTVTYSTILIILIGLLAMLLQYIYTKLDFTENIEISKIILSTIILVSALTIITTFHIIFSR